MKKFIINVPENIEYMSDWKDFAFKEFPNIIDKQLPGCGFTEMCLRNDMPIILCCPRKILLRNKAEQHNIDFNDVYLVTSDYFEDLSVDKNISFAPRNLNSTRNNYYEEFDGDDDDYKTEEQKEIEEDRKFEEEGERFLKNSSGKIKNEWVRIKGELLDYLRNREFYKGVFNPKILVTYDSYRKVKDILDEENIFDKFYTVVDEFQSIFTDSKFKSDFETEFTEELKGVNKICYVSATPMLEQYLDELDEFKDLPYYVLDWSALDKNRVLKPKIFVKNLKSVNYAIGNIVRKYLDGKAEVCTRVDADNKSYSTLESHEAVFYVNSINNICSAIKSCKLEPKQVNILCANNSKNKKKINARLNKGRPSNKEKFEIGKVPLKNEKNKMFTFCTRTVYIGSDFYSDNAKSYVVSDANIDSLAVDISLDLPQIIGRQRLDENPWRESITLFIKLSNVKKDKIFYDNYLKRKTNFTNVLLNGYESCKQVEYNKALLIVYGDRIKDHNFMGDYLTLNGHAGSHKVPVFNRLAFLAEKRSFEIQQIDYADRFSIRNRINNKFSNGNIIDNDVDDNIPVNAEDFIVKMSEDKEYKNKFKYFCKNINNLSDVDKNIVYGKIPDKFRKLYSGLGEKVCRSYGYDLDRLEKYFNSIYNFSAENLEKRIKSEFTIGSVFTKPEIKNKLQKIYDEMNYYKVAKSVDILNYYNTERVQKKSNIGTKIDMIKIIGVK